MSENPTQNQDGLTTYPPPNGCTSKFLAAFYKPNSIPPFTLSQNMHITQGMLPPEAMLMASGVTPFTMIKKGKMPKITTVPKWYSMNPHEMGFIPRAHWKDEAVQLSKLINEHFRAKSTKMIRFEHKLWNALSITTKFPDTYGLVGVKWVTPNIIKVDRKKFGERMLCLTRPNASLFNPQGSFQSHGFEEITAIDALQKFKIPQSEMLDVDETKVRLYQHKTTQFTMLATPEQIEACRWQAPAA